MFSKLSSSNLFKVLFVGLLVGSMTISNLMASINPLTIHSYGEISYGVGDYPKLTVILRNVNMGMGIPSNITKWVDNYVAEHSYGTAVTLCDMHQYGVWWYGYSFSQSSGKWMGWTFSQLKTMIDRFHYYGWQVGLESTGVAWSGQEEYNYINNLHKELAFTDANGMRVTGSNNPSNLEKSGTVVPDFFKKFTSDDPTNNIPVGTRLIDLYCTRLEQMIRGGLEWDFWFGTDGWNGFLWNGYRWQWTGSKSTTYSFSLQETDEWANDTTINRPAEWYTWDNIQRADWIVNDSAARGDWFEYWQDRFSRMYAQIRQAFINAGRPGPFYTIGTVDLGSPEDEGGGLSPAGMFNLTKHAKYNSFDYYYVDVESDNYRGGSQSSLSGYGELQTEQAFVTGVAKSMHPNIKTLIGLQAAHWSSSYHIPGWVIKQEYLAQAMTYVWYNGTRYRASDPTVIMLQYPAQRTYNSSLMRDDVFPWIRKMAKILMDSEPLYLGPTFIVPMKQSGSGISYRTVNFTFTQYAWVRNLADNPAYIQSDMGSIWIDLSAISESGFKLSGLTDRIAALFSSGNLSVIVYSQGYAPTFGSVGLNEAVMDDTFHLSQRNILAGSYTVVTTDDIYGKWITDGYLGLTITPSDSQHATYYAKSGFIPLVNYTQVSPNGIALGIYYNSNSGKFLYGRYWSESGAASYRTLLPRSIINNAIYWASNSPVNSSESLIDIRVFRTSDGSLFLPMMNHKDTWTANSDDGSSISTTLQINPTLLGLGQPSDYNIYWQNTFENAVSSINDWSNIPVILKGMADILVIAPKNL